MNYSSRATMIGFAALLLFSTASHAEFPERNLTSVVTFSPGGGFDTVSRAISRSIGKYLPKGIKTIVKNVTGAGGITGTVYLYRAKPDGYTIGQMYGGMIPVPFLRGAKKAGFDFEKFTWLARIGGEPFRAFYCASRLSFPFAGGIAEGGTRHLGGRIHWGRTMV